MRNARTTRRRSVTVALPAVLVTLLIAVFAAGCGSSDSTSSSSGSGSGSGGGKLDVVGYSTPESVYSETLEPAFEKTSQGKGVSFSNSFGASGDQSRAVVAGQPASVVTSPRPVTWNVSSKKANSSPKTGKRTST